MSALAPEKHAWLEHIELATGKHSGPNGVACVMEAVSYIAGEPWSDHPECASKVITVFLIRWNDAMNDADRQILKPLIPRLVGTKTSAKVEEKRAWMLTDWLAREYAPAWLRLAGLTAQAELLEGLSPLTSAATARKAQPTLETARTDACAAWAAAGDAAWAAAGDAAWAAAGDAAGAAARAAAGDAAWAAAGAAAGAAAWAAVGDAAWAAAGDAAGAAARAAAGDAAWAAAGDAAWAAAGDAAWAAARAAAGAALAPTVKTVQPSALLLVERMIEAK